MPGASDIPADYFPPELARLSTTAIEVLAAHVGVDGRCVACMTAWPCEPAQLADHNLAGL